MFELQYVFQPKHTNPADIRKEVYGLIINMCVGKHVIGTAPMPEPYATGEIRIDIVMDSPSICLITDNPSLDKWMIKPNAIAKVYPDIRTEYTNCKNTMKDKPKYIMEKIQSIRMQERLSGAGIIIDTIKLFKHAGWHTNVTQNENLNFERIHNLPSRIAVEKANSGTRWDILYALGLIPVRSKLPSSPHAVIIKGDNRLKYVPRCNHAMEGVFFICWVSHIKTPLSKLPPGDAYCAACSANITQYEQIAVMDVGPITAQYLHSIGEFSDEYVSVVVDIVTNGVADDTNNVLIGKEWVFIKNSNRIFYDVQRVKLSRYIGKKIAM